jgi:single-stranded-DNA-specific exonuclease
MPSSPPQGDFEFLRQKTGLPRAAVEVLLARGLSDLSRVNALLNVGEKDLHDPFLLRDLEGAARRIAQAVEQGQRIVVHGDYDCDGISGAVILTGALRRLGAKIEPFVPDREKDGYGVSQRLVRHAGAKGVALLITVDTGSSAHEALELARELGMETVVCDHHLFAKRPLGANWLINPQREDDSSPNEGLCGTAVAWKLICGVEKALGRDADSARELDLVALALLADQMPLTGENRALCTLGLQRMRKGERPGLVALEETARLTPALLDEQDVLYQLAPRINAAGRIASALRAVELLLAEDQSAARPLAAELDALNRERRKIDAAVTEEALEQAERLVEEQDAAGLVLASPAWHMGVVGIAASRVVERFHRPAVLLAISGEEARGSGRATDGFHLKRALDACSEHLSRYGGHAAAAGMTLPRERIDAFRRSFAASVASMPHDFQRPPLRLDARLRLSELDAELVHFLQRFGPYGQGHPEPLFGAFSLNRHDQRVLKEAHLKLQLAEGGVGRSFIGFGLAPDFAHFVQKWSTVDVAFHVRFQPRGAYDPWQLRIRDLRAAQLASFGKEEVSS